MRLPRGMRNRYASDALNNQNNQVRGCASRRIKIHLRNVFNALALRAWQEMARFCDQYARRGRNSDHGGAETSREAKPAADLAPEVLETPRRQLGVAHRVLDIAVAKVGLQ